MTAKPTPLVRPKLIIIIFLILAAALGVTLARAVGTLHSAKGQAVGLRLQITEALMLREKLLGQREFMGTDTYIEREARIEYGLSVPGAVRFVAETAPFNHNQFGQAVAVFAESADDGNDGESWWDSR